MTIYSFPAAIGRV